MKVNYHTHSGYCDGKGSLQEYVEAAIEKEITHLGFSGHAPIPIENTFAIASEAYADYCNEIRRLQSIFSDKIHLYLGLEIDYIPGILDNFNTLVTSEKLDYFIGSVHLVNNEKGSDLWFIDGSEPATYDNGLRCVFGGDIRKGVTAFFRQNNDMILSQKPPIIGHLDKIVMHNKGRYFDPSEPWFIGLVNETLDLIKENDCVCELNTRGLYKGRYTDYYPSKAILLEMKKRNIPIVVSTDAHQPCELDCFENAYDFLREINYPVVVYFENGWKLIRDI